METEIDMIFSVKSEFGFLLVICVIHFYMVHLITLVHCQGAHILGIRLTRVHCAFIGRNVSKN